MDVQKFIRQNEKQIDEIIEKKLGTTMIKTDRERELWLLNDEQLYRWAKSMGVKI